MTAAIVVVVVAVVLALAAFAFVRIRRSRPIDGVESFRRHIDALSPESRREVIDRVQNARDSRKGNR